jgi:excisionase family DNA binding protein
METHELLAGEKLSLAGLGDEDRAFLRRLAGDAERDTEYFTLLRRVKGPGALPLRGGAITPAIATSVLYRVAHDIADRVGIAQGYLLAPDVARSKEAKFGGDLLSLTEAAELIGITRPAAHQALVEQRLRGWRVGNAWVVKRTDAEAYRKARSNRTVDGRKPGRRTFSARAAAGSRR